jgi:hypothetical protein
MIISSSIFMGFVFISFWRFFGKDFWSPLIIPVLFFEAVVLATLLYRVRKARSMTNLTRILEADSTGIRVYGEGTEGPVNEVRVSRSDIRPFSSLSGSPTPAASLSLLKLLPSASWLLSGLTPAQSEWVCQWILSKGAIDEELPPVQELAQR